jgi:hypothetical protein
MMSSIAMIRRMRPAQIARKRPIPTNIGRSISRLQSFSSSTGTETPKWLEEINVDEPIDSRRLYRYMRLKTFTDSELRDVFQAIQNSHEEETKNDYDDSNAITEDHIRSFLEKRFRELEGENDFISAHDEEMTSTLRRKFAEVEAKRFWKFFEAKRAGDSQLTQEELVSRVGDTARSVDMKRIWPITLSMLLVGSSVGVVAPAMPFVVQVNSMSLSFSQYFSAFFNLSSCFHLFRTLAYRQANMVW